MGVTTERHARQVSEPGETSTPDVRTGRVTDAATSAQPTPAAATLSARANSAMERYADGDDEAFAELYDALATRIHAFLQRQTGDRSVADDLLQQTFLQMHHARGHFVRGAAVTPWAFAIARRLVIDRARRGRFETTIPVERVVCMCAPEAEDLVQARQLAGRFEQVLRSLPENQRVAFTLVREEGLSLSEAAEILGTTTTAVKLRVFRASEALREVVARQAGAIR